MANSSEKSTNNPDVYGQNTALNSNPDESYFPFLSLPPELRNRIYHYYVLDHGSLTVCDRRLEESEERLRTTYDCRWYVRSNGRCKVEYRLGTYQWRASKIQHERPQVSILAINKQIHREAGSILYQNLFEFDCEPEGVPAFLRDRPHWALEFITRVGLHLCKAETSRSTKPWRNLCKTIRKQLRLKELILYLDGPFWEDGWEWTDLDEVEWIRQLVKITGLEKLSIVMYEGYDNFAEDEGKEPADHLDTLLRSKMLQPGGEFQGWRAAVGTWSDWQAP